MEIILTTGVGQGPTAIAAFDQALLEAGIANYNLIYLSSIIPANTVIRRTKYVTPPDEYGHRLYIVIARCDEATPGKTACAGIGWTQEEQTGRGLFVELHSSNQDEVEQNIHSSLQCMIDSRSLAYGSIQCVTIGQPCTGDPVCALVAAVYQSQGWGE